MSQPTVSYPHREDSDPSPCFHCGEIGTPRCVYEHARDCGHACCTGCTAAHHGAAPLWDTGTEAIENLTVDEQVL